MSFFLRRFIDGRENKTGVKKAEFLARAREYDSTLKAAALLGQDAGEELFCLAHPGDPVPKAPDPSMWMRWEVTAPAETRHRVMMFNAQMAYAIGRAEGYLMAFEIDMFDMVHSSLREAS